MLSSTAHPYQPKNPDGIQAIKFSDKSIIEVIWFEGNSYIQWEGVYIPVANPKVWMSDYNDGGYTHVFDKLKAEKGISDLVLLTNLMRVKEGSQKKKQEEQSVKQADGIFDIFLGWMMGGSAIAKAASPEKSLDKPTDKKKPG